MLKTLYQWLFRFIGVRDLYVNVVEEDCFDNINTNIRRDLQALLKSANQNNPYFKGRYTEFLDANSDVSDEEFLQAYSKLPALTKQDYAEAGQTVMAEPWNQRDPAEWDLQVQGKPMESIQRLRQGNYLMQMATGGSTSMPLVVQMTKHHMFSMLFTFFKCWYRMGWRPGERMLVFYPKNTYNIDDMVKFNPYSKWIGFRYHLFDKIDEQTVRDLVEDINHYKPRLLLVFPSPLNMIAHTIRKYGLELKHHPALINVSGETFFDCQRKNIQDVFAQSKVEDSYGSVELGELAHETEGGGLEIFTDVAYVETEPNENGQPEMVITRLKLTEFPFIRYKMKDIAEIEFRRDHEGRERYVITKIEGKDSNYILSDSGQRSYPSFFNSLVNELNQRVGDTVIEIKVYERGQKELEVQFIILDDAQEDAVREIALELLREQMSPTMAYQIRFVEFIDHDYRRKYRVIERIGDIEFAGGMVGDQRKSNAISEVVEESRSIPSDEKVRAD